MSDDKDEICWFVEAFDWRDGMRSAGWWTGDEWNVLTKDPAKATKFSESEAKSMASVMTDERVLTFYLWKATEHMFVRSGP